MIEKKIYLSTSGYILSDAEFNIAAMFKREIMKVYDANPLFTQEQVAKRLGVGDKFIRQAVKKWNINIEPITARKRQAK